MIAWIKEQCELYEVYWTSMCMPSTLPKSSPDLLSPAPPLTVYTLVQMSSRLRSRADVVWVERE